MKANRVDINQAEIVAALRGLGASVQPLQAVRGGCPDLLVGWRGRNYLLEVKGEHGRLTECEDRWLIGWTGQVQIVHDVDEALAAIGVASC